MRIVGGKFRGRVISGPEHDGLRPTSDRVRENIFNILLHGLLSEHLEEMRVIDLFAGTGALGLEALSRGASYCLFVDNDASSRALMRQNIETLILTGETKIFRRDATDLGQKGTMAPFDVAFIDPPYGKGLGEQALISLVSGDWLKPQSIIVWEERSSSDLSWPSSIREVDRRVWGETQVAFGCYEPFQNC